MMHNKEYINDKIGDEYTKWKAGDMVFITSPTGTGKTHFILDVLVPYAWSKGKKILYLVNRRVLRDQLIKILSKLPVEQRSVICITTYQEIENKMRSIQYDANKHMYCSMGYAALYEYCCLHNNSYFAPRFAYIICDECHYFLADSNFNTNTGLSYRWIQDVYASAVRVFMSATIGDFRTFIDEDEPRRVHQRTSIYGFDTMAVERFQYMRKNSRKVWEYKASADYDYIRIKLIDSDTDIADVIKENDNKNKWLIFVDSIKRGEELKKKISDSLESKSEDTNSKNKNPILLMTSDYDKDENTRRAMEDIVNKKSTDVRILITTSVMDNGVSIEDLFLRNVIIYTDTEAEFIQMLGRKREDGEPITLYLCKRNKEHFSNRINILEKRKELAERYWGDFINGIELPLKSLGEDSIPDWGYFNQHEMELIVREHKKILQELSDLRTSLKSVNCAFNVYDGILYLNRLSYQNIQNIYKFYEKMVCRFEEDGDDAFVYEQLRWLGFEGEEARCKISEASKSRENELREKIMDVFRKDIINRELPLKEACEKKLIIIELLKELAGYYSIDAFPGRNKAEQEKKKRNFISNIKKSDRPLSEKSLKFLGLPIRLKIEDDNYIYVD